MLKQALAAILVLMFATMSPALAASFPGAGDGTLKLRKLATHIYGTCAVDQTLTVGGAVSLAVPLTAPNVDSSVQSSVSVTLTNAQLDTMFTTPIVLIPAPGAGKTIIVRQLEFVMTTTSTAVTGGGNVTFQYSGGNAVTNNVATAVVTAGAGTTYTVRCPIDVTAVSNTGITITNGTAVFAGGTAGTTAAKVNILYTIL